MGKSLGVCEWRKEQAPRWALALWQSRCEATLLPSDHESCLGSSLDLLANRVHQGLGSKPQWEMRALHCPPPVPEAPGRQD